MNRTEIENDVMACANECMQMTDEYANSRPNTPDTRSRNRRQKPAPENWRRFLERLSYNLAPDFATGVKNWRQKPTPVSGAGFWTVCHQHNDV